MEKSCGFSDILGMEKKGLIFGVQTSNMQEQKLLVCLCITSCVPKTVTQSQNFDKEESP